MHSNFTHPLPADNPKKLAGIAPFLIGTTSTQSGAPIFQPAMLLDPRVYVKKRRVVRGHHWYMNPQRIQHEPSKGSTADDLQVPKFLLQNKRNKTQFSALSFWSLERKNIRIQQFNIDLKI